MGEFVVTQVKSARTDDRWLDYSRCTAPQAVEFLGSTFADSKGTEFRAKHWITGRVLNKAQLECMASYPDGFNEREPREWWRVTMHWEGESDPTEVACTPYIYMLGKAISDLHARGLESGRGDVMRIEIVGEDA